MSGDAVTEPLLAGSRLIWYLGVLLVVGASTAHLLARAARSSDPQGVLPRAAHVRLHRLGLAGAGLLVAGVVARLYAQTYAYFGVDEGVTVERLVEVATVLPPWSQGWLTQFVVAAATAVAFLALHIAARRGWVFAHLAAWSAALTMPLTGHAVAQEAWPRLPVMLQALHVLTASVWLGGLTALVVTLGTVQARAAAALVARFSPVALTAALLLTASGIGTTVLYLGTSTAPWATPYGMALLAKLLAVAGVATVGFLNWRWRRPQLETPGGLLALRQTAALELALAVLVLALTARLTGLPQPQ